MGISASLAGYHPSMKPDDERTRADIDALIAQTTKLNAELTVMKPDRCWHPYLLTAIVVAASAVITKLPL